MLSWSLLNGYLHWVLQLSQDKKHFIKASAFSSPTGPKIRERSKEKVKNTRSPHTTELESCLAEIS